MEIKSKNEKKINSIINLHEHVYLHIKDITSYNPSYHHTRMFFKRINPVLANQFWTKMLQRISSKEKYKCYLVI